MTTFKALLDKNTQAKLKNLTRPAPTKPVISTPKDSSDEALFLTAMRGVTPLSKSNTAYHQSKKPQKDPTALLRRANAVGKDDGNAPVLSDMQALLNPVSGESFLSHKTPTLQNKVFEQLKAGKLRWYQAVDLHGADIDDARNAILALIDDAKRANETVIKIVHGKGSDAIIKTCVNGWLRQMSDVLAFVSAPPKDGGHGAVLVLLKRSKMA